jgi:hypothetical protein
VEDLVQWLRAQLDEDERTARAADAAKDDNWWWGPDSESAAERHVARHDPARVLREIDAKRQLIELHQERLEQGYGSDVCAECDFGGVSQTYYPCATLRLLALPYTDQPGYQEAWRP